MTDAEIIKALECCYDLDSSAICHQCPLYQTENCRDGYLGLQALHLINRQKAREKAITEHINLNKQEVVIQFDDKQLERLIHKYIKSTDFKVAKSEAIKEFAERLKSYLRQQPKWYGRRDYYECVGFVCDDVMFVIDKLVKEMAGEDNA